ncbi:MAG TPA: sodium/proton-translocating pyrophosphatase, partial [Acetivibrio sp.]|nr:sodium/proton-translocating pyrophosphatase [Acetivibrio sp.]
MFPITTQTIQIVSLIISALALGVAAWLYTWVKAQPSSNKRIAEIGEYIRQGANTFLKREYLVLARFTAVAAILIAILLPKPIWTGNNILDNILMAVSYVFGTVLSALAGKIGIQIATIANIKAAEAAQKGVKPSFMAGFRGGAVMGMAVVGTSLLGVTLVFMIIGDASALLGFSFGASSLALFAKAGGGIFTKTADISADL